MKSTVRATCGAAAVFILAAQVFSQEVKTTNSKSWDLSGNIQLQHLYNTDLAGEATRTNQGFRIRRGRLVAKGKLTDYVETSFQIEVRDNSPRLKDAEGKIKLASELYFRFGQFKVPVWREELRSSTRLLLLERSAAADFLVSNNLSARHIGVEFGRAPKEGLQFIFNLSNGAG
ncbi:MAG: porin, partial [candidate division KSB1 bacterium]